MKFLVILCLLAFTSADEDTQEKKTQPLDTTQNTNSQTATTPAQPTNTLQVFPATSFSNVFGTTDPISNLAYTGFNGNVSPIQPVNPDFFVAPATGALPVNAAPSFPVTRTVLPGTNAVVNGIQSAFPVTGNVFPAVGGIPTAVSPIPAHFPTGILPAGVPTGAIDPNGNNPVISPVAGAGYRFLTPDALSGIPAQGLQAAQQVGLAAIPAFTSGILPSLANLQGQNIQQVLKNPTGNPGIPNVQGVTNGNIPAGPLTNVFRHA